MDQYTGAIVTNEEIWKMYRERVPKNEEPAEDDSFAWRLRERILVNHVYLTSRVVGKMKKGMPAHVERDDLESLAKIGLMQAVLRFDNTKGVPFEAFATQRMRSVIMDGIRESDWAPRSLRKKDREIRKVEDAYQQKHGVAPTNDQIAEKLELSSDDVAKTKYQASIASHTYINTITGNERGDHVEPKISTDLSGEEVDTVFLMKSVLSKALRELPIRQAAIIAMHYYDEKNLSDIAGLLNMSEVKIGKLHREAVLYLWRRLEEALRNDD